MKSLHHIRLAKPRDIEACVALDASNFNIYTSAKRGKHFEEMIPRNAMLVAEDMNRIVAYASFEPDWFGCSFLKLVVVDTSSRRLGLASQLIKHIEDHYCPLGRLFSSTEDDNTPSKAMHEKLGFQESGYLDNLPQPHREIFYYKKLNQK